MRRHESLKSSLEGQDSVPVIVDNEMNLSAECVSTSCVKGAKINCKCFSGDE